MATRRRGVSLRLILPLLGGAAVGSYFGGPVLGRPLLGAVAGLVAGASIGTLLVSGWSSGNSHGVPPMWPFVVVGAVALAVPVVISNLHEYEGVDVIIGLTPLALAFGAFGGLLVGALTRGYRRRSSSRTE